MSKCMSDWRICFELTDMYRNDRFVSKWRLYFEVTYICRSDRFVLKWRILRAKKEFPSCRSDGFVEVRRTHFIRHIKMKLQYILHDDFWRCIFPRHGDWNCRNAENQSQNVKSKQSLKRYFNPPVVGMRFMSLISSPQFLRDFW